LTQVRDNYNIVYREDMRSVVNNLNMVLGRLASRLDQMEGLRGTPTFYKNLLRFITDSGMTAGQVLTAQDAENVAPSAIDWSTFTGFLTLDHGGLGVDISAYSGLIKITAGAASNISIRSVGEDLLDGLVNIYDASETLIHQFLIENIAHSSEWHGFE
jgi:hypothetical protein